jgi:hypothetical protein
MMGYQRISPQFEDAYSFSNGKAKVTIQELEGYIDTYGSYIVRPLFESISLFGDSLILIEGDEDYKLARFDGTVIPTQVLDEVGSLVSDRAIFQSNEKVGYLNGKGKVVINPSYDAYTNVNSEGEFVGNFAKVSKGGKFGIIDKSGKVIVPISYNKLGAVSSLIAFEKGGKWGFIDLTNKVVFPASYEYTESFANGLGIVQDLTLRGAISSKGQLLIPIQFTSIKVLDESHFLVTLGAMNGIYTNKGELVVPVEYNSIRKVQDDHYLLTKGQELHYFYAAENKLIKPAF